MENSVSETGRQQVLDQLPQKPPFLFIDKILELSEMHIVAEYRYREDEFYFAGHFPGDPVTPGVILIETMAQAGLVALGIYLLNQEGRTEKMRTLFSDCTAEFSEVVRPGDLVTVHAERVYWRFGKLKSKVELRLQNGKTAASGIVSGMGVVLS